MKKILILLILNSQFFISDSFAQAPNWLWAKRIGGSSFEDDIGHSVATDAYGNVYTTGVFVGTVDFNPGAGVYNLTAPGGADELFISKLDANGNFVWAKNMGGIYSEEGHSIAIDAFGNIYTIGDFEGVSDFDPGVGIFNLTSAGYYDTFISKLDSNGNFIWAKALNGTLHSWSKSLSLDALGNVYTVGSFFGTVDFDPGIGIFNLTSAGYDDIFVSKLDSGGNFIWAKVLGGTSNNYCNDIVISSSNSADLYITGNFSGTADFDPGIGVFNLTSPPGSGDIYICKLDSSGNFIWAKTMGGSFSDGLSFSIAMDSAGSGDIYITGLFQGTIDFDPGVGVFNLTPVGYYDIYVSKLSSSGNFIWTKTFGGTTLDRASTIILDPSGNGSVYTTGFFSETVDFDPGLGVFNLTSVANTWDIFISKLDSSGNFVWAKKAGGTDNDGGNSLAFDASGNLFLTGFFSSPSITFSPTTLTNALGNGGNSDIFITKLNTTTTTGINDALAWSSMTNISPNPFSFSTTIQTDKILNNATLTVYNIFGQQVKQLANLSGQTITLYRDNLSSGVYFIQLTQENKIEMTNKLVVTD